MPLFYLCSLVEGDMYIVFMLYFFYVPELSLFVSSLIHWLLYLIMRHPCHEPTRPHRGVV